MRLLSTLACLALLLGACGPSSPDLSSYDPPPSVDVTFNALLPSPIAAGETVFLTILDELTGLEYNPQHLAMLASGDRSVTVSLSVPTGTLLKYRFTRQGPSGAFNEIAANGQGIPYRAYLVDGPGHVAHDVVAAWADAPLTLESGQVSGTITDSATGQPLAGLRVIAAGIHTTTDEAGFFTISGLPQGLHSVLVFSPSGSHLTYQQGALVAASGLTPADIRLTPALMANVTFVLTPPADHTAGTPIFLTGDLAAFASRPLLGVQTDGTYALTMQLPVGVDLRYKYSLGDAFWNAEHLPDGGFSVRQLIISASISPFEIQDTAASWSAGSSGAIWFDLTAPAQGPLVYIQFNLGGWTTPLPMWPLGDGHWAYKLYSPTNFADPLEYRYCLDAACTVLESSPGAPRSVTGNQPELQQIEDHIDAWQQ